MQLIAKEQQSWKWGTALTSAQALYIPVAMENNNIPTICDCCGCRYLTWGAIASHTFTIEILGSLDPNMGTQDVLYTQNVAAATYSTPYLLAAPLGQGGDVILTRPYIRIKLTETATANHTYTRFYAVAWW